MGFDVSGGRIRSRYSRYAFDTLRSSLSSIFARCKSNEQSKGARIMTVVLAFHERAESLALTPREGCRGKEWCFTGGARRRCSLFVVMLSRDLDSGSRIKKTRRNDA